jgi:hypothetical protein
VIFVDEFGGVFEVACKFPYGLCSIIAALLDEVLEVAMEFSGVEDLLHLPLYFRVDDNRRRRWGLSFGVRVLVTAGLSNKMWNTGWT